MSKSLFIFCCLTLQMPMVIAIGDSDPDNGERRINSGRPTDSTGGDALAQIDNLRTEVDLRHPPTSPFKVNGSKLRQHFDYLMQARGVELDRAVKDYPKMQVAACTSQKNSYSQLKRADICIDSTVMWRDYGGKCKRTIPLLAQWNALECKLAVFHECMGRATDAVLVPDLLDQCTFYTGAACTKLFGMLAMFLPFLVLFIQCDPFA